MQFKALFGLVSVVAAFQGVVGKTLTSLEQCGENPKVLSTKTITHEDIEAVVTTYDCPGIAKRDNILEAPSKRQITNVCGVSCTPGCATFNNPTPTQTDCQNLAIALEETSGNFVAAPNTITVTTHGSCAAAFLNVDPNTTYEYCFIDYGSNVFSLASQCIPANGGGLCDMAAENWGIEIFG